MFLSLVQHVAGKLDLPLIALWTRIVGQLLPNLLRLTACSRLLHRAKVTAPDIDQHIPKEKFRLSKPAERVISRSKKAQAC